MDDERMDVELVLDRGGLLKSLNALANVCKMAMLGRMREQKI